ncbi:MAG: hypothetical protein PWP49_805 [Thermococcaceae archaeon]|jgi:hypothetical protein|uniref:hypothetical protein n=1 Tax=Thermococcus sp. PK TaxID=913025 RepID=UPI0006932464|nr:hypothetical protein [Thermococcus sp. PK]MDN5320385.1 hypothetical protein [Thermococcaceae archaeon]
METDLLTPKERYSGVVFIGVRKNEVVEFIKVYAENEELARDILERFLYEKGIHPADFIVVDKGYENVEGKEIISTRTESELSAFLGRLGLRLLSNGILYLQGKKEIYQITSLSKELLREIKARGELKEEPIRLELKSLNLPPRFIERLKALELMEDTLVINHAELPLSEVLERAIKGTVKIPEVLKVGPLKLRLFDNELHEVLKRGRELLIKPPVVIWDSYVDSLEDFEAGEIGDGTYRAPLFLKAHKGFLILREPPEELLEKLLRIKEKGSAKIKGFKVPVEFTLIVESKNPKKYDLPVKIKLPYLSGEEFKELLEERVKLEVPDEAVVKIPEEKRTFRTVSTLSKLLKRLKEKKPNARPEELLNKALVLFLGEENEDH